MKAVLISIQPKWCALIAQGQKTVEVRKTKPKLETPFKCYIYCTKDGKNSLAYSDYCGYDMTDFSKDFLANGHVIGEFVCDKVFLWNHDIHDEDTITLDEASKLSCLSEDALLNYADGYFYGWHICRLKIYDEPKELSAYGTKHKCNLSRKCTEQGFLCAGYCKLTRPPQSWCYVEEMPCST